jgi:hypothetical protein
VLIWVDIHPPDIIEVTSGGQVTCFANTAKGDSCMLRWYGRTEVVFEILRQAADARAFTDWTETAGLKVLKFGIQD